MAKAPTSKPETETEEPAAEGDAEAAPKAKRFSGKKLVLFVALPLLLLGGGGAGAYFMGFLNPLLGGGGTEVAEEEPATPSIYYEMPEMLVNLTSTSKKPAYLKLRLNLELADSESAEKVEAMLPRIVDSFQIYLRALRIEDLLGSAGLYRLRQELLSRATTAVAHVEIRDVLFKEMLVQ
jgi:flagellar FliL protein